MIYIGRRPAIAAAARSRGIVGTACHCDNGDASAQTALHNSYPSKDIWFTECSGFQGQTDAFAKHFSDRLNLVVLNSGTCLDLRDLNTADGARMQLWTCTGGPAQSFRLVQQP